MIEYIHIPEDEEIEGGGGAYQIREDILQHNGRELLCVRSEAHGNLSFCCGCGCTAAGTVFVKGHVLDWKAENEKGELVSRLETIGDPTEQERIRRLIEARYGTSNVQF